MNPLADAEAALEAARSWDRKGDANWARRIYGSALLGFLRAAVREPDEVSSLALLRRHGAGELLATWVERDRTVVAAVESGLAPSVLGGPYEPLVFHHVALLLGRADLAAAGAATACRRDVRRSGGAFWCEYARAVEALGTGTPYEARPPARLRGLETCWAPYLDLVADLTHGRAPDGSLARVDDAFRRRNADRRLSSDAHGIEGSGRDPVHWDFRRAALLAAGS